MIEKCSSEGGRWFLESSYECANGFSFELRFWITTWPLSLESPRSTLFSYTAEHRLKSVLLELLCSSLPHFLLENLSHIADPFVFIGLRPAEGANRSRRLTHLLLIHAGYNQPRLLIHCYIYT